MAGIQRVGRGREVKFDREVRGEREARSLGSGRDISDKTEP